MYGIYKTLEGSFDEVLARVTEALKEEGFGVLTEIDVQATLKAKLGVERSPYRILGACNPALAHQALEVDADIGLLLPCNVVVQKAENGSVRVGLLDPATMLAVAENPQLEALGKEVRSRLERVRDAL